MKLRILDETIRLRVSKSEVARLGEGGVVEGKTPFPSGWFIYRLVARDVAAASADFQDGCVEVVLPSTTVETWSTTSQVSILVDVPGGAGRDLRLLVEKDFKCLAPRDAAEDADAFDNPNAGATC